jgi:hypothetical protein
VGRLSFIPDPPNGGKESTVAKWSHADVLDGMGNVIKTNCTRMIACSTQPTTFTEATVTYELADVTMSSSDFTLGAYNTTGRQCTVGAKTGVTVDNSGTFAHVAFVDVDDSKLLYVTTGTNQVLTAGNTCDFPSFAICKVPQPS